MGKERPVTSPLPMPEIVAQPPNPERLALVDELLQGVMLLAGFRYGERRLLKVDDADRLMACPAGQEANRVTQNRYLAAALPATVVFQPDTVAWAVVTTAGGVEVDPQDVLGVSYGAFTIHVQGVWEMHIPCGQVVLTASVWTLAPASHVAIIEWRRL